MHLAKERWYAVLTSEEVPHGKPSGHRRLGHDLVFWRDASGSVVAAVDQCPHRGVKLSIGSVQTGVLACPFHGFQFDGSGACTFVPAHPERPISPAMRLSTVHLHESHGFIWIWTGDEAPTSEPPFFDFGERTFAGTAQTHDWPMHYTRAIENQLDFAHLKFVHANTIGRFVKDARVVPNTTVDGDLIRPQGEENQLELLGPNVWRLYTPPDVWQCIAFAPIDEDNMRYYMRAYRSPTGLGPVDWLLGKVSSLSNGYILGEDKAVMITGPLGEVRPKEEEEVLVPSDSGIVAYRRWREPLRGPFAPVDVREALRRERAEA